MSITTSRVIACWRALHTDLTNASWSAHPTTGEVPLVGFGVRTTHAEQIVIPGRVPGNASADWATIGPAGRDEVFRLAVEVLADTPGQTDGDALDRLEELIDVVQTTLRSSTTGKPAGTALLALGITTARWQVADITPVIVALDQGFGGRASIDVEFKVRI